MAGGSTNDDDYLYGHGTMMAGIAAAITNNNEGIAGVSWGAKIMPVKVCGSATSSCNVPDIAEGVIWAADQGADILLIIPTGVGSPELQAALEYAMGKGALVVAAVGNTTVRYPAVYEGVVGVGVTDQADVVPSWSARGTGVDVTAPGISVYSTDNIGRYNIISSTTAAAAHVSGVLALLLSKGISPDAAVQAVYEGAVDLGAAGWDPAYGWGRLDACGAFNAAGISCPSTGELVDSDGDGCPDEKELGLDETKGGRRDPNNPYDFFDVPLPPGPPGTGTRDGVVNIFDALGIPAKFGTHNNGTPDDFSDDSPMQMAKYTIQTLIAPSLALIRGI